MSNLAKTQIARLPEVIALVVTDENGALLESTGDFDSEAVGAVHATMVHGLTRCGNALGLGTLQRLTVAGPSRSCLIGLYEHELVGIYVDPSKPIAAFEKKLETALRR